MHCWICFSGLTIFAVCSFPGFLDRMACLRGWQHWLLHLWCVQTSLQKGHTMVIINSIKMGDRHCWGLEFKLAKFTSGFFLRFNATAQRPTGWPAKDVGTYVFLDWTIEPEASSGRSSTGAYGRSGMAHSSKAVKNDRVVGLVVVGCFFLSVEGLTPLWILKGWYMYIYHVYIMCIYTFTYALKCDMCNGADSLAHAPTDPRGVSWR